MDLIWEKVTHVGTLVCGQNSIPKNTNSQNIFILQENNVII